MKKNIKIVFVFILFALVVVEILCSTRWVGEERLLYGQTSIPYFICGLFIGIIPLFKVAPIQLTLPNHALLKKGTDYGLRLIKVVFGIYLAKMLVEAGQRILANVPIDPSLADMLPIIRVMCQRFINGETIYEPIPEIWGGIDPIYLPAMWAPFVPFEYFEYDIRWGSILGIILSIVFVLETFPSLKRHTLGLLLVLPPLFYWAEGLWAEQTFLIRYAEEGVVIFHYAFLGFALIRRNPYLIGVGMALCILSRYGLLFWAPFFLLFSFFFQSKREALISAGVALFIGVFFFLIPYGIENFDFFISLPNEYPDYARRLWDRDPNFFATTLGLAKFFSFETVDLQHRMHLTSVLLAPLFMLLAYWQLSKRNIWEGALWGICSLKFTLTFFYNLIIVPVLYLFWVPPILSCLILAAYIKHSTSE